MFNWFRRWRRRRQRLLLAFFDGQRQRNIDPYAAYIALECHESFKWSDIEDLEREGMFGHKAAERAMQGACDAFDVEPYDSITGKGLTAQELIALLYRLLAWMEGAKKKLDLTSTSSPATDGESSNATQPSSEITNSSADSS